MTEHERGPPRFREPCKPRSGWRAERLFLLTGERTAKTGSSKVACCRFRGHRDKVFNGTRAARSGMDDVLNENGGEYLGQRSFADAFPRHDMEPIG